MAARACTTCKITRRFLLAFTLGGALAWLVSVTLPFPDQTAEVRQGVLWGAVLFSSLSILIRIGQVRIRRRR